VRRETEDLGYLGSGVDRRDGVAPERVGRGH
jgi:hypothetical protein